MDANLLLEFIWWWFPPDDPWGREYWEVPSGLAADAENGSKYLNSNYQRK